MPRSKLLLLLGLLLVPTLFTQIQAQAVYGSISGTVTDPSGAVVPEASVTITSKERNTTDTVTTNDSGLFTKERLLPGTYEVKIEKTGFKTGLIQTVVVNVDTQTSADFALVTGQVSETVTVSGAEGELLKTDRADVATTFESRQVTDLPILDRNFTRLILLTPGTQQQQWQHAASENPQGSIQTIVNGQTFAGTGFQLDGTENRDPILGIIVINPNFEAIGETKITSQNYDAEFGQAIAGIATVQTRSGTNNFHGSLFDFRQSDALQARNPFSQSTKDTITGLDIPATLRNQFGGSIGGPIKRDRLFFFGDYQGTRSRVGGSRLLTVPTLAARSGDFTAYNTNIYDPLTGQQFSSNGRLNVIPQARISPQALSLLRLIPAPNLPGRDNGTRDNFASSGSELFNNDTFDTRIDGRISEKFNVFGRYSFADYRRNGTGAFGQAGGRELVTLTGNSKVRNQSIALGFDYTLSPTAVLDFRFGAFKYNVNVLPFDFGTQPARDAGIPGLNLDTDFTSGLPYFNIQGDRSFQFGSGLGDNGGRCNCPLLENERQSQFVSNLSKVIGNHTLKFGVDLRFAKNLRVPSDAHRSGELTFSDRRTSSPTAGGGIGIATFLIGDVTSFARYVSTSTTAEERQFRHFYYAQDTWRYSSKLTFAYGLRLDVINPQKLNAPGNGGFVDISTGEVRTAGVGNTNLQGNVKNSLNFAPRLGIAYQITPKTVIRAGYGRSYDIGVFGSLFGHTVTQNLPVLARQNLNADSNFGRVFTLAQGPPAFTNFFGLNAPPNRGGVPNTSLPANGVFFLPDGVTPRVVLDKQRLPTVDAYNVTVQHQLTKTASVEVAYVGNKATHTLTGENPETEGNPATLEGFNAGVPRNQRRPFFQRFGWTQDVLLYFNFADNRYNALQAKFTKKFANGNSILTHYTLQRIVNDDRDSYFVIDRSLGRGIGNFNRTHNFVFVNVTDIPIGRNRRFFSDIPKGLNYLIGGLQFNSTTTLQSGFPFSVTYNGGRDRDTGPNRANVNGNVQINGGQARYLDPGAFSEPNSGTFGNQRRNTFTGPGYWRTDASLFKKFIFSETKELEFRVEVVNLFNHVNLDLPDTNLGNPLGPINSGVTRFDNANFGRISSTAFGGNDLQRNFQFALKFKF